MIDWFCGPESYRASGIGRYSSTYIEMLRERYAIRDIWIQSAPRSLWRILHQYVFTPIRVICTPRRLHIFSDEGWLPILLFPIRNAICIIHDVRDFSLTTESPSLFFRIYFSIIRRSFSRLNHPKVRAIVAVSEYTKRALVAEGIDPDKIVVIYNAFDLTLFQKRHIGERERRALYEKYQIPLSFLDKKVLLNIGTEEERKNIMTFLRVVEQLPEYIGLRIGRPIVEQNRQKHQKYVQEHTLPIVFIDQVDAEELVDFYSLADIFLLPSTFEGFGRTPVEAQACELALIASDKGALSEVLGDSSIVIHDPYDVSYIVEQIRHLDQNPADRQSIIERGKQNSERFSRITLSKQWELLLHSLNYDIQNG